MDTTQLLLTIVLSVTTILLIFIGIQLIFVLKEIRTILKKANDIVKGFEKVGLSVEHGLSEAFGFVTSFKSIFKIIELINAKKNGKTK